MMASRTSAAPSVALAVGLVAVMMMVWNWRAAVSDRHDTGMKPESWAHVKKKYPQLPELAGTFALSPELVDRVVRANPFSASRRRVLPVDDAAAAAAQASAAPPPPRFIYKGRVQLGTRVRAVVEETTTGKTYFLEVGQAVAGFKVLDIAENQVVLSDPQTDEEVAVFLASPKASPEGL